MSRFSSRVRGDLSENEIEEDEFVDVSVKAFMNVSMYYPGIQKTLSRFVLIEDARSEAGANGPAETFVGRDGETGERIEITVSYPDK